MLHAKRKLVVTTAAFSITAVFVVVSGGHRVVAAEVCVPTSPEAVATHCMDSEDTPEITLLVGTTEHAFFITMNEGAKAAAEELGVTYNYQGAKDWGPSQQTSVINAVIETKPDAVAIVPTDPKALDERLQALAKAGIVVFTVDTDSNNYALRHTQIASENELAGEIGARVLAKAIGGKGKVFVVSTDPTTLTPTQRSAGFNREIAEFTGVEVLDTQYCGFEATKCAAMTNAVLTAHSDLAGIFSVGEPLGKGAANALRNAGVDDRVVLGSFDASPAQVRDLKQGVIDYLVVQKPYQIGFEAIRLAKEFVTGMQQSDSPLLPPGTKLEALPQFTFTGFAVAVNDSSLCEGIADPPRIVCGTADDPEVSKWFYTEG
jgi:ribose transport system substrate-binding protein